MSCGKSGYWHTEWRTGYIVETDVVAEGDGPCFAPMLATNPKFYFRAHSTSVFDGDAYQPANSNGVEDLKRVVWKDTTIDI